MLAQASIAAGQDRQKKLDKGARAASGFDAGAKAEALLAAAEPFHGGALVIADVPGASDDQLRSVIDSIKKREPSHAVLLAAASGDKLTFIAVVSDDLIAKGLKAGDWVKAAAKEAGGGGGGRPQMAQAGGKEVAKLAEALKAGRSFAR